jgi:hypothetical protein
MVFVKMETKFGSESSRQAQDSASFPTSFVSSVATFHKILVDEEGKFDKFSWANEDKIAKTTKSRIQFDYLFEKV